MSGETMAEAVKRLRLERAWSQEELATVSGLNVRTIQRLENGAKASLETLKAVAGAFDLPVARLNPVSSGGQPTLSPESPPMTSPAATRPSPPQDRRRGFHRHLAVYVIAVVAFVALDLLGSPDKLWFPYPALGWGIGVAVHGLRAYFADD